MRGVKSDESSQRDEDVQYERARNGVRPDPNRDSPVVPPAWCGERDRDSDGEAVVGAGADQGEAGRAEPQQPSQRGRGDYTSA